MNRGTFHKVALALFAPLSLLLAACGNDKPAPGGDHAGHAGHAPGKQLSVTIDGQGYHPSSLTAPPGEHVRVTFKRTSDEGCGQQIEFPELKIRRDLPLNQPVDVDLTMPASGSITFQCGMAMYKGTIVAR